MIKKHKQMLPIAACEVGMILAEDVLDRSGRILSKEGNKLTERSINVFKSWGVGMLPILVDDDALQQVAQETLSNDEIEAITHDLFSLTDLSNPVMKDLAVAIAKRMMHMTGD